MEYNFKYSLTEDEFVDFNTYTSWFAPWQKKVRLKNFISYFIICLIFSSLAIFAPKKTGKKKRPATFTLSVIIVVSGVTSFFAYSSTKYTIQKRAKKFLTKEENNHILTETELAITEDQIIDKNNKITSFYKWESIKRYAITENNFYLYTNMMHAIVIPKRLFNNKDEEEHFNKFILAKIPLLSSFRS